jgi:hypothetical protein
MKVEKVVATCIAALSTVCDYLYYHPTCNNLKLGLCDQRAVTDVLFVAAFVLLRFVDLKKSLKFDQMSRNAEVFTSVYTYTCHNPNKGADSRWKGCRFANILLSKPCARFKKRIPTKHLSTLPTISVRSWPLRSLLKQANWFF